MSKRSRKPKSRPERDSYRKFLSHPEAEQESTSTDAFAMPTQSSSFEPPTATSNFRKVRKPPLKRRIAIFMNKYGIVSLLIGALITGIVTGITAINSLSSRLAVVETRIEYIDRSIGDLDIDGAVKQTLYSELDNLKKDFNSNSNADILLIEYRIDQIEEKIKK